MITWNKGEPPKDGKYYLVTILTIKGQLLGTRRIGLVGWNENVLGWSSCVYENFVSDGNVIIAWSENNIYEGES